MLPGSSGLTGRAASAGRLGAGGPGVTSTTVIVLRRHGGGGRYPPFRAGSERRCDRAGRPV